MGRPISTTYSDEERESIIEHVLAELSAGIPISKTLGDGREEWLCSERCFWNWYYAADAEDRNGLVQKVARARDCGIEARLERAFEVADTPMMGEIVTEEPVCVEGKPLEGVTVRKVRTEDMLGHRKLVVDTALKAAAMLKPKKYGARQLLGSDPDNPLPQGFTVTLHKGGDA